MNAAIPDTLREFVQTRVAEGGYASIDEYIERLVEADLEQSARDRLETELLRGLAGEKVPVTAEDFHRLREEIQSRSADKDDSR
jgi:Arc/MetJ-type ribon-helix-helix transcriptional regulator